MFIQRTALPLITKLFVENETSPNVLLPIDFYSEPNTVPTAAEISGPAESQYYIHVPAAETAGCFPGSKLGLAGESPELSTVKPVHDPQKTLKTNIYIRRRARLPLLLVPTLAWTLCRRALALRAGFRRHRRSMHC